MNFEVVKEPRGFMKVLQFFFAILAFATTSGFSTHFSFHATSTVCKNTVKINHTVTYPFALDHQSVKVELCPPPAFNQSNAVEFRLSGNMVSDSRFYVALGVFCMFLSAGLLLFYAAKDQDYTMSRSASIEFAVNVALAVLLFAGSCAWADGVRLLKNASDPSLWAEQKCADMGAGHPTCSYLPDTDYNGNFAKLNVSLIFGFLNVFLWTANLWFIYKETVWYSRSHNNIAANQPDYTGNI